MNWINRSVRNKLLAASLAGIAVLIAAAVFGFGSARQGLSRLEHINGSLVAQADEVLATQTLFKEQVQEWKDTLLRGYDPKLFDKYWGAFGTKEQDVRKAAKHLQDTVELPKAKELLAQFLAAHEEMGRKYRAGLEKFKAAGYDPKTGDLVVRGIDRAPTELLGQAATLIREAAAKNVSEAQSGASRNLDFSVVLIVIAALATVAGSLWLLVRIVVRPLVEASRIADAVAGGDLTVRIESKSVDEAGRLLSALARMREGLAESVGAIRQSAEAVGTASKQIATGNAEMSSRTEEQASSLEETASSMEELTTTVKQNADNAKQANQFAIGASEVAERGGQVMGEVVATMSGISDASRKIADIIGVIDGIAFQTNILALNAAVEAARAGEQGRGFAVVASEVRSLAQRSAAAAKEIKALIENSVERVDGGTKLVESAGETMAEIVSSVKRVTDIMADIAAASQEQLSGIEQVSSAVMQMDQVTQQNAAIVEESAAAAESMASQAEQLQQAVARFTLDARQSGADNAAPRPERHVAPRLDAGERARARLSRVRTAASLPVPAMQVF